MKEARRGGEPVGKRRMKMTRRRGLRSIGWMVLAIALVGTACLGPGQFDPTGRAPIGALELVVDAAGGIRVKGWTLDPETSASLVVKVGSEGVVHDVLANRSRPDVAAAYPGYGAAHGFDYTFGPLPAGLRGICVWVPNQYGAGDDRLLGCQNIQVTDGTPVGALESLTSLAPRTITASGWVFDPNTTASSEIVVNIDGNLAARVRADDYRADIAAAYGRGSSGYQVDVEAEPGSHQVCVATFNIGYGIDRLLGCDTVVVAESTEDRRPVGELTSVEPQSSSSVSVAGTASDPDGNAGLKVRLDIDSGTPAAQAITLPVTGGEFSTVISGLDPGLHTICPVGLDVDGGFGVTGDRAFVCGSTFLDDLSVGTAGTTSDPTRVAPPSGHPLELADRDAGVSVELRDGSLLWFFGDTLQKDSVGTTTYFVNNTAAWAAAGSPTVTRDAVDGSQPYQFVESPHSCSDPTYPNEAIWPESAVAVPQPDGTDKVLVFASKVCLGTEFLQIEAQGMALVEYTYDPADPPIEEQIEGELTQDDLFGVTDPYGRGAVLDDDDSTIYTYQCGRFTPLDQSDWGPCNVGRVDFGDRRDPAEWEFWDGGDWADDASWSDDPDDAAAIESYSGDDVVSPVAAFTLTFDATHGYWLMVYSPWPGFTDRVEVRVADSPVGPFTDPVTVVLPGCDNTTGGVTYRCYAGTAQPKLSESGMLGVGYYDQLITAAPLRGQYLTVTVPFNVVATPG
ncbi:MAG: hypothetical protein ACR2OH_12945 [Microthrixaceae bacterium]